MKTVLLLPLLILTLFSYSQESKTSYKNFILQEDKTIIWQKVFETDEIFSDIEQYFSGMSFTSNLILKDSTLMGRSAKSTLSSKSGVVMAAYGDYDCLILIDMKDGKYRVTISDLKFDPPNIQYASGSFFLSDLAVRDNHFEIRGNRNNRNLLDILDNDFTSQFIIKIKDKKDDW